MGHINLSIKCHVIIVIKVSETRLPGHKFLFHPLCQCELGNHLLFPSSLKRDDHSISLTQKGGINVLNTSLALYNR